MYVEKIKSRQRGKTYMTYLVRESYREKGKVRHRTLANISQLPPEHIDEIKRFISGEGTVVDLGEIATENSREYGASFALLKLAGQLKLDKRIYSVRTAWRENVLAMIVGRIIYQGSKLSLVNAYRDTALWELCGHQPEVRPDVDRDCYQAMDELLSRRKAIQKSLAKRHLKDGCLILYDITNFYLEGEYENSFLAAFGRNKDGKKGHKQIAVGLLTDKSGCPVGVEVFSGNTSDQTTVLEQAEKISGEYGVKSVIFAGDRGMLTPKRIAEVNELGYKTITALTHPQINKLLESRVIQMDLFDDTGIEEVRDPDQPEIRYLLCRNPETAQKETATRARLVNKISHELERLKSSGKKRTDNELSSKVGAVMEKYKAGKYFDWKVKVGKLSYSVDEELLEQDRAIDGCYVVRTEVDSETLSKEETVKSYRGLAQVEQAFRNLKTVLLEIRPIYHHLDERMTAHVFICMLAYYIQWHMMELLAPLFENDGQGEDRRWSVETVIERLKSIRIEKCILGKTKVAMVRNRPDSEQKTILDLLGVKM